MQQQQQPKATPHVVRYSVVVGAPSQSSRRSSTWPSSPPPPAGLMTRTSLDRSTIDWSQLTRPFPVGPHRQDQRHVTTRVAAQTGGRLSAGRPTPPGGPGITVSRRTAEQVDQDDETFWRRIFESTDDCESRGRYNDVTVSLSHVISLARHFHSVEFLLFSSSFNVFFLLQNINHDSRCRQSL